MSRTNGFHRVRVLRGEHAGRIGCTVPPLDVAGLEADLSARTLSLLGGRPGHVIVVLLNITSDGKADLGERVLIAEADLEPTP